MNILLILKLSIVALSILFYLISLTLPAFNSYSGETFYTGLECLILGILSFSMGIKYFLVFLTNFLYYISLPLGLFRVTSYFAIPIMVIALLVSGMVFLNSNIAMDLAGYNHATTRGSGMYLWYMSYVLLFVSLFIPAKWGKKKSEINRELHFPQDPTKIY